MGVGEGRPGYTGAELAGIAEAIGLAVAGGAGNGVIHADAAIIEEDPAKAGRPVGDGIISWGIIVRRDRAIIIGWQCWAGEIVQGVEVDGGELRHSGWRGDGPIGHHVDAGRGWAGTHRIDGPNAAAIGQAIRQAYYRGWAGRACGADAHRAIDTGDAIAGDG